MKIVIRMLFVAFLLTALHGMAAAAGEAPVPGVTPAPAAPSIQLTETSYDFGEVFEGKEYSHDFIVKNVGTATLQIKKVLPG